MTDNVNKPSHYQGSKGLEAIDVVHKLYWEPFWSICFLLG